jgi:hypothetical protein
MSEQRRDPQPVKTVAKPLSVHEQEMLDRLIEADRQAEAYLKNKDRTP